MSRITGTFDGGEGDVPVVPNSATIRIADGATGRFSLTGDMGVVHLSYSDDGGQTWTVVSTLTAEASGALGRSGTWMLTCTAIDEGDEIQWTLEDVPDLLAEVLDRDGNLIESTWEDAKRYARPVVLADGLYFGEPETENGFRIVVDDGELLIQQYIDGGEGFEYSTVLTLPDDE